jgi:hypothetical protein
VQQAHGGQVLAAIFEIEFVVRGLMADQVEQFDFIEQFENAPDKLYRDLAWNIVERRVRTALPILRLIEHNLRIKLELVAHLIGENISSRVRLVSGPTQPDR